MPEIKEVFVDYYIYCPKCKHKDKHNWEDPCNECVGTPVRDNTSKPANYEPKE